MNSECPLVNSSFTTPAMSSSAVRYLIVVIFLWIVWNYCLNKLWIMWKLIKQDAFAMWSAILYLIASNICILYTTYNRVMCENMFWELKYWFVSNGLGLPILLLVLLCSQNLYCTANITTCVLCVLCHAPSLLEDKYVITNIARLCPISNSAFVLIGYGTQKRYIFPYSTLAYNGCETIKEKSTYNCPGSVGRVRFESRSKTNFASSFGIGCKAVGPMCCVKH